MLKTEWEEKLKLINTAMHNYLPEKEGLQDIVFDAMRYSVFAGGKRLRPILMMAACEFAGGSMEEVLPFACAIEMIHTYSLIHDDLPAMDNDDYRRGKLTNHKIYGEGIAILAGDGLLNYAFELMIHSALENHKDLEQKMTAIQEIVSASGIYGMIGGQVVDLISENKQIDSPTLSFIHKHKTASLIIASVRSGAILGGATEAELEALTEYAENIGFAFQIKDDILDLTGDEQKLGKRIGGDIENQKSTYPSIHGLDAAVRKIEEMHKASLKSIKHFGEKANFFADLADYLMKREF
jgi:geranylgeranyl diphosphate synthase type II